MKSSKFVLLVLCFLALPVRPVFAQTVARVDITADTTNVVAGQFIKLSARAKDAGGNIIPNIPFTWSSSNTNVATVEPTGVVISRIPGTVQIRARTPTNVQGTLNLNVIPAGIVLAGPDMVRLNSTTTLTASALDVYNNAISGLAFTWTSDNPTVVTVTNQGVAQAVGLGEAVITAAFAGFSDSRVIRVERSPDFTLDQVVTTDFNEGLNSQIQTIAALSNMNARGDIAFVANLSGKTSALLRDIQGHVTAVARSGDVAPLGGTYSAFTAYSINSRGDVVFVASVANGIGPVLVLARGDEIIPLLVSGDFLEVGGTVGTITLQPDGLDDNGFVTVHLTVTNPNYSGVFRISPDTGAEPLIRTIDATSIGAPTALGPVSVSSSGRVAVLVTAGARRGIYTVSATAQPAPVIVDGTAGPGGIPFSTFAAVRSVSDSELFFTGTVQGGALSVYRATSSGITEVVRGGQSGTRTIAVTALLGGIPGTILFSGSVSDLGAGIFAWSEGNLRSVAVRNAPMPTGEILTRLDFAWINAAGDIHLMAVTDNHLSATYRVTPQGSAQRWVTGSIVPVPSNYSVTFSSTLRPGPDVAYFLAGVPLGLFQKSGNVVTPVAVAGRSSSRGAYTGVQFASSNANGDLVFVASSLDLARLTTTVVMYRYTAGTTTELIVFGQPATIAGMGEQPISNAGLNGLAINTAGQVAFVGGVGNRQTLLLAGAELQVLVQANNTSPTGGTFTGFTNLQITTAGTVVFTGAVNGGPTGSTYVANNGQVAPIATTAQYPGLSAPVVGGEIIYFIGRRGDTTGLWAYSNGTIRPVISIGELLPTNTTVTNITGVAAQEDGTVAFQAVSAFTGLFTRRPDGTMSTVVLAAERAPVTGRFGAFGVLSIANSVVVVNSVLTQDRMGVFLAWPGDRPPPPPVTSMDYTVVNRSTVSLRTEGLSPDQVVGYANVRPGEGTAPSGLAIFSLRQGDVLVSEATVPATGLLQEGRIYAETTELTSTGIAIANPGTQPASISFYFTDSGGTDFGGGTTEIPPGGQIARFLHGDPFYGRSSLSGSFTFASSQPVSVIALRGYVNERSEFLMTTLPVVPLGQPPSGVVVFPHFADGEGWTSQVVLVNPTNNTLRGSIEFLGRSTRRSAEYSIAPKSSFVSRTPGVASSTDTGWVQVTPTSGTASPSGLLIFTYRRAGVTVSEAGVPSSSPGTAFRMYMESAGNISASQVGSMQTGIAIVNPGSTPVTVNLDVTNLSGASMGITGVLSVPARGQVATFVNQISGMDSLLSAQGVLRIAANSPVAVIGLRGRFNERSDFLITTIEPTSETSAPANGDRYMPHFVDSGGYTTQFILYSGTANQSSSGSIRFFSQTGQALGLTLR